MQGASITQQKSAALAARRSGGYRKLGASLLTLQLKNKQKSAVRDEATGQFHVVTKPQPKK